MKQAAINRARADRVAALLASAYEGATDWRATIADALSDMAHLCDRESLEFVELMANGASNYESEISPDDIEQDSRRRFAKEGKL